MNIKRAFLAAVAVLMVPGFAMAQSTTTFPTTLNVNPDPGAVLSFTVTRSCNSGSPLSESTTIADGGSVTFTATDVAVGSSCVIGVAGGDIPAGWEANSCSITTIDAAEQPACDLVITQTGFDFTVEVEFDDSASDASGPFSVDVTCENVLDGGTLTTLTDSFGGAIPVDTTYLWEDVGVANDEVDSDGDPINVTMCTATADTVSDSTVEISGCSVTVQFGDEEVGCVMVGSVFFEGIPTLSQYGMAIMALLMLAVGFVGFRRFV